MTHKLILSCRSPRAAAHGGDKSYSCSMIDGVVSMVCCTTAMSMQLSECAISPRPLRTRPSLTIKVPALTQPPCAKKRELEVGVDYNQGGRCWPTLE